MMNITVLFSSQLATRVGQSEQSLELPDGASLSAALQVLAEQHGDAFAPLVFNTEGQTIRNALLLVVDGEQALDPDQTILKEGSELMLLMPMAGG